MKSLVAAWSLLLCSSAWAQGRPEVSEVTGDLNIGYSFDLPKARGRFQPRLYLSYSSSSRTNEGVGYGWTLSSWYIEKDLTSSPPSNSVDSLSSDRGNYWFMDGNERTLLVPMGTSGSYRPFLEKSYFAVSHNSWSDKFVATDGQGTAFTFTRALGGMKGMKRWYLSKVEDLDGNITEFSYAPVSCSGSPGVCTTNWLQSVGYNVTSSGSYATTVGLVWKNDGNAGYTTSEAGLMRQHDRRLWRIQASGPTGTANYQLCYSVDEATCLAETAQSTGLLATESAVAWRPRLFRRAMRYGGQIEDAEPLSSSGVLLLPATQYKYGGEASSDLIDLEGAAESPQPVLTSTVPVGIVAGVLDVSSFPHFVDMDADGKPDLVWGPGNSVEPVSGQSAWAIMDQGSLFWARNITPVGATALNFDGPQKLLTAPGIFDWTRSWSSVPGFPRGSRALLRDFNGDGIPDIARTPSEGECAGGLQVYIVKPSAASRLPVPSGADPVVSRPLEVMPAICSSIAVGTSLGNWGTVVDDINNDGIPDIARASLSTYGSTVSPPADMCLAPLGDGACASCSTWIWKIFLGSWQDNGALAYVYWGEAPTVPGGLSRRYGIGHTNAALQTDGVACLTSGSAAGPFANLAGVDLNGDGWLDSIEFSNHRSFTPYPNPLFQMSTWGGASPFLTQSGWAIDDPGAHPIYSGLTGNHNVPCPGDPRYTCEESCTIGGMGTGAFTNLYLDVNGDGLVDEVRSDGHGYFAVLWGTGLGFAAGGGSTLTANPYFPNMFPFMDTPVDTLIGTSLCRAPDPNAGLYGLMTDLNGDGVADYVIHGGRWYNYMVGNQVLTRPGPMMFYAGRSQPGALPKPYLITEVVTPERAHWGVTYGLSTQLVGGPPSIRPVIIALTVSGDHVKSNTVRYTYANWQRQDSWVQTGNIGSGGFSETWSFDVATGLAQQTKWMTESPSSPARPVEVNRGTATYTLGSVPTMTRLFEQTTFSWSIKDSTGTCNPLGWLGVTTKLAPLHVFASASLTRRALDLSTSFAVVWASVACANVDSNGHVLKSVVTPKLGAYAGKRVTTTVTRSLASATQCPDVPGKIITVKSDDAGSELLVEGMEFDQKCRQVAKYFLDRSKGLSELSQQTNLTKTAYTTWGRVLSTVSSDVSTIQGAGTVEVVKTFEYEGDAPNVKRELLSDALRTLATTYQWDLISGLKISQTGPALLGGAGALIDPVQRFYAYDELGREVGVSKSPFSGGTSSQVVQVTEFDDGASPRAIRGYRFAQPKALTLGDAAWRQDAGTMLSVVYFDEVGRQVQARERLGSGMTALASEGGRVTQGLTGWRVTKAISYDAAGRELAALEPFYSGAGATFEDFAQGASLPSGQVVRATFKAYDERSRVSCVSVAPVSGAIPFALFGECSSNFADDALSRLATQFKYTFIRIPSRGPYQGGFASTEVVPPDQNAPGKSGKGTVKLAGALGEDLGAMDADGNRVWIERDALLREVGSWRESGSGTQRTPSMASVTSYNTAGQVVETWDMNSPTVTHKIIYDKWGRIVYRVLNPNTNEGIGYEFGQGQLGRVTSQVDTTLQVSGGVWSALTSTVAATYLYDEPASLDIGSQCAAASAPSASRYVAGRLSLLAVPNKTSVVYSYDDAGRVSCRDQRFSAIDGGQRLFTVTSDYGGDGRVLHAKYGAGGQDSLTQSVDYDSAGRPVVISGVVGMQASTNYWEAVAQGGQAGVTGAYDALGRIGVMHADGGAVASVRAHSPYTGQLTDEWKSFTGSGTMIHQVTGTIYEGSKVKTFTDDLAQTSYNNSYLPSGKLSRALASTIGSPGPLSQGYDFAYAFNGIGNLASATETVTLPAASSTVATYLPVTTSVGELKDAVGAMRHSAGTGGTAAPPPNGTTSYTYDLRGNLTTVVRNGVVAEQLAYGPAGELLSRQVGEKFILYVGEYMTVRASGAAGCASAGTCAPLLATVEADYHVLLAATRIVSVSPSRTLYYYRSRLGTVVATSLAGGVLGAQYRYDPYGKLQVARNETSATASEYGYTNALRLTGDLWHLKARVYDAAARVFLQSDSVDRYRYAYVRGDPANLSDPTGLLPVNIVWEGMETSGPLYGMLAGILADGQRGGWTTHERAPTQAEDAQPPPTPEAEVEKAKEEDGTGLVKEEELVNTEEASAVRDARRSKLIAVQDAARVNPDFAPTKTLTWCNKAVVAQATAMDAPVVTLLDMQGSALLANDQADRLRGDTHNGRAPGFYREVAVGEAQTLANDGYLVIPIWKNAAKATSHGHEVTVRPEGVPGDKIKPGDGPIFNDVGSQRKVTRDAFPVPNEVHYYTPRLP